MADPKAESFLGGVRKFEGGEMPTPDHQPPPSNHPFEYKMIQVPSTLSISADESVKGKASSYLQQVVAENAVDGWEFFRVDAFYIQINPGCLMVLFGFGPQTVARNVVTFRRAK